MHALLGVDIGYAQQVAAGYTYETWTRREGLPSSGVSYLASTGDGYIWFTTFDGLVCGLSVFWSHDSQHPGRHPAPVLDELQPRYISGFEGATECVRQGDIDHITSTIGVNDRMDNFT